MFGAEKVKENVSVGVHLHVLGVVGMLSGLP